MKCSFLFGTEPNAPLWRTNFGTTIYFSLSGITEAALFVRCHGPSYLQDLSIKSIRNMLQNFLVDNFHIVGRETFSQQFTGSYASQVSESTKRALTRSLTESSILSPINELTLFPLVPVEIVDNFTSNSFFLREPNSLHKEIDSAFHQELIPEQFPPLYSESLKTYRTNAWLGIRSPCIQTSKKRKSIVLGAVALTLQLPSRHRFSLRKMFGGIYTFGHRTTFTYAGPHTPPLVDNLIIRQCDHDWLGKLSAMLDSNKNEDQRHKKSLEYYFRAWSLEPPERFPVLCMSLDAIFGEDRRVTQSVVEGVQRVLGEHIDGSRLRKLLKLRASVIHGEAPSIYDSEEYMKYYQSYETDPINDLDEIVTESLRRQVFDGSIVLQVFPSDEAITKLQESGRLPKCFNSRGILNSQSTN